MEQRLIPISAAAKRLGVSIWFWYSAWNTRREPYYSIMGKVGSKTMVDGEQLDQLIDKLIQDKERS